MPVRRALLRLTAPFTFRRRLPAYYGGSSIFVSTAVGGLKFLKPMAQTDPPLLDAARRYVRAGDTVWDIGANVGLFAFSAAGLSGPDGQVYAADADCAAATLLLKSAALPYNGRAPVEVLNLALGDRTGNSNLVIASHGRAMNFIEGLGAAQQETAFASSRRVEMTTIDRLCETRRPPDLLKVDVEGAEKAVLHGGIETLRRYRPTIICEVDPRNRREVSELLLELGYRFVNMRTDEPVRAAVWATVAIHSENARRV